MIKKILFVIFVSFFVLGNVHALDTSKGQAYLNKTLAEGNWNFEVEELSLGLLALKDSGYDVTKGLDALERKKTGTSWNDNIKKTSLAILALDSHGRSVGNSSAWLKNALIEARVSGDWLIQVNTDSGKCVVSYGDRDKTFDIVDGKIVQCSNNYWIDIKRCVSSRLDAYAELLIDCSASSSSPEISLLYKEGDSYRVMPQQGNVRTTLTLESGCFGETKTSTRCDYLSTAYATWVLTTLGESDIYTTAYLTSGIDERIDSYAFGSLATLDESFATWLASKQALSGSWDSDIYRTGLSVLALRQNGDYQDSVDKAVEWLSPKQKSDGALSTGRTALLDTEMVVYGVLGVPGSRVQVPQPSGGYCGDLILNENEICDAEYDGSGTFLEGDVDNCLSNEECVAPGEPRECTCKVIGTTSECSSTNPCSTGYRCVSGTCEREATAECVRDSDCNSDETCNGGVCEIEQTSVCNTDADCDLGKECQEQVCIDIPGYCFSDTDCGDGEQCVDDICEVKKGFPMGVIIIVFVILLLGVGGFFAYQKFMKKPKKESTESFFPKESPLKPVKKKGHEPKKVQPKEHIDDVDVEDELDSSLRTAKELLGEK